MIYDVIIIGAGASGLFSGVNLDKNLNKLILEKTAKIGTKLLLSGGERANVTNINMDIESSYFSQNKKFLHSIFSKYNNWDFMSFCAKNGINLIEEDRGRMILESAKSKELLDFFLKKLSANNCKINLNSEVISIEKKGEIFNVELVNKKILEAKNVILSSGGRSFSHTGTSGDGYKIVNKLGMKTTNIFPGLCGITTKNDLKELSGISTNISLKIIDTKTNKIIYTEVGPLLFTHFGLSGPIIFNSSLAIGEYLASFNSDNNYLIDNLIIELEFDLINLPKKIANFFDLSEDKNIVNLNIHSLRGFKEAKVTTGGINLNEIDNNMQSKKYKGLFLVGEVVDVTGKTGGYNLQWAWSSSFVATEYINKIFNK